MYYFLGSLLFRPHGKDWLVITRPVSLSVHFVMQVAMRLTSGKRGKVTHGTSRCDPIQSSSMTPHLAETTAVFFHLKGSG